MKGHTFASSRGLTFSNGTWHDGNPALLGPRTHGVWLGSTVFDGARYFDGVAPDLLPHCERAVRSAHVLGLEPMLTGQEIAELAWEGIRRLGSSVPLYIMPTFWAEDGALSPAPETTQFALCLYEAPLPEVPTFSACVSSFRRPARDMAPTDAKAACLYPNVARCVREAANRGFNTAVVRDAVGNVAEFAYTNLFYAKGGVVYTPAPNGSFLNGLTRQRIIALLRDDGVEVIERSIDIADLSQADEIFSTGNYSKVLACTKFEDQTLPIGPMFSRAKDLYWRFARMSARS